jgi:hypothetical protein
MHSQPKIVFAVYEKYMADVTLYHAPTHGNLYMVVVPTVK